MTWLKASVRSVTCITWMLRNIWESHLRLKGLCSGCACYRNRLSERITVAKGSLLGTFRAVENRVMFQREFVSQIFFYVYEGWQFVILLGVEFLKFEKNLTIEWVMWLISDINEVKFTFLGFFKLHDDLFLLYSVPASCCLYRLNCFSFLG